MTDVIEKTLGNDFESANSLHTPGCKVPDVDQAAGRLLTEIKGFPDLPYNRGTAIELNRRFLSGAGGSAYIDSGHLEMNTPEHRRAKDHAAHVHAALRIARQSQQAASRKLPHGTYLRVLANNCDGHVSYGNHCSILTTTQCFNDILYRKPHLAGFLATHLVTSVPYSGQGMVGAANGRAACTYQLSQRADWFEALASIDTMQRRPLINQRNEPHAASGLARLHLIYYDLVLAAIANFLQAGTLQLVVAMCESGWADPNLQLDDPVGAASQISRDLSLRQRLPLALRGRNATAVEIQHEFCQLAGEFVGSGAVENAVPDAEELVAVWNTNIELLRERDIEALAPRCDNWQKYLLLERHRGRNGLAWSSPDMKALDLLYSSIDPDEGLFLQMAEAGYVADMPSDAEIRRFAEQPPDDTRAYLRAHILRRFGADISRMDWSWIEFRVPSSRGWWSHARLDLPDPRRHTKQECEAKLAECQSLEDLVDAFTTDPGFENDRALASAWRGNGRLN